MNKQTEALKMAISAMQVAASQTKLNFGQTIQACKEALEQPAQKPVAWSKTESGVSEAQMQHRADRANQKPIAYMYKDQPNSVLILYPPEEIPKSALALYTHPAPSCQECENLKHDLEGYMDANKALINREWVSLSDDEIEEIANKVKTDSLMTNKPTWHLRFARAIEAKVRGE